VGLVRMGWRIEDVIVIRETVVERGWRDGQEIAYKGRMRRVLVGFVGLSPVQTSILIS